jgi:hypothetical protein
MELAVFNAVISTLTPDTEVTHFNIEGRPYDVGNTGRYTWIQGALGQAELLEFTDKYRLNSKTYTEISYVYEIDINQK